MNTQSVNFKPEARTRLMVIFGAEKGAKMFDRLDHFCTIARESGEKLIVPPDVDIALHEVLSVRPPLELTGANLEHLAMEHIEAPAEMEHMLAPAGDQPHATVGKTMAELVDLDDYRERAQKTLKVLAEHNFTAEGGNRYDQPACTLGYAAA